MPNSFEALNGSSGSVDTQGNVKKKRNRKKKGGGGNQEEEQAQLAQQLSKPEPQGWKVVGKQEDGIPPGMEDASQDLLDEIRHHEQMLNRASIQADRAFHSDMINALKQSMPVSAEVPPSIPANASVPAQRAAPAQPSAAAVAAASIGQPGGNMQRQPQPRPQQQQQQQQQQHQQQQQQQQQQRQMQQEQQQRQKMQQQQEQQQQEQQQQEQQQRQKMQQQQQEQQQRQKMQQQQQEQQQRQKVQQQEQEKQQQEEDAKPQGASSHPAANDPDFQKFIQHHMTQVREFNAQNFKEQADSAFHRDMVELAFSGFQRLQTTGASEDAQHKDLVTRMEIVQLVQKRLASYAWQKNSERDAMKTAVAQLEAQVGGLGNDKQNAIDEAEQFRQHMAAMSEQGGQMNQLLQQENIQSQQRLAELQQSRAAEADLQEQVMTLRAKVAELEEKTSSPKNSWGAPSSGAERTWGGGGKGADAAGKGYGGSRRGQWGDNRTGGWRHDSAQPSSRDQRDTGGQRTWSAPGPPGQKSGSSKILDGPPGLGRGPPGLSPGPPGLAVGPPGLAAGPPGLAAGPPGLAVGPPGLAVGPPGLAVGPPGLAPPGLDRPATVSKKSDAMRKMQEILGNPDNQ